MTEPLNIQIAQAVDLEGILALQAANQLGNGGNLSALFSAAQLVSMMQKLPQLVAKRGANVVGFLLSSTIEDAKTVNILQAMLTAYPTYSAGAYVYGPICVASAERGQGIAQMLFAFLKQLQAGREGVLFIRDDNTASLQAHQKMGMQAVSHFDFNQANHIVLSYMG